MDFRNYLSLALILVVFKASTFFSQTAVADIRNSDAFWSGINALIDSSDYFPGRVILRGKLIDRGVGFVEVIFICDRKEISRNLTDRRGVFKFEWNKVKKCKNVVFKIFDKKYEGSGKIGIDKNNREFTNIR